jgi:hypothetical protein
VLSQSIDKLRRRGKPLGCRDSRVHAVKHPFRERFATFPRLSHAARMLVPCQATFALSDLPSPRLAASSTTRRGAATPSGLRPCQARRCLRQNRANVT